MPEISVQKQCLGLTNLVDTESFGAPIGDLPKQTDAGFFEEGNLIAGAAGLPVMPAVTADAGHVSIGQYPLKPVSRPCPAAVRE